MARLVPDEVSGGARSNKDILLVEGEAEIGGGCGSANGRSSGGEMADMEKQLLDNEHAQGNESDIALRGQKHDRNCKNTNRMPKKLHKQQMGKCKRCGYLSSQDVCKACMLLEGLNKNKPKQQIEVSVEEADSPTLTRRMEGLTVIPIDQT